MNDEKDMDKSEEVKDTMDTNTLSENETASETSDDIAMVSTEMSHKSNKAEAEVSQDAKKKKSKDKKKDNTIEKLKSKAPEEIQKEIKDDIKSTKFKYKTLSIIVSVILFLFLFGLALAVSYYKNTPTPPETNYVPEARIELPTEVPEDEVIDTSDWETYENEEYGFSLKHTNDTEIVAQENNILISKNFKPEPQFENNNFRMSLRIIENTENLTPNEYFIERCNDPQIPSSWNPTESIENCLNDHESTKEPYKVDSVIGLKSKLWSYESMQIAVVTLKDQNIFVFTLEQSGEIGSGFSESSVEYFEQILSTFKFAIEQVQGVSTTSIECVNENQEILSEVSQCEELTEESCLTYVDDFDYCMKSCLNVVDEEECTDICRPVCGDNDTNLQIDANETN